MTLVRSRPDHSTFGVLMSLEQLSTPLESSTTMSCVLWKYFPVVSYAENFCLVSELFADPKPKESSALQSFGAREFVVFYPYLAEKSVQFTTLK